MITAYQAKENVILVSLKTKPTKKDFQHHYRCHEDKCPFQIKLLDKDGTTEMFTSDIHTNHNCSIDEIGKFFVHFF